MKYFVALFISGGLAHAGPHELGTPFSVDDFVAPIVYDETYLPGKPTGQIYFDLSEGAFKGISQTGSTVTLSAPGAPATTTSSDERIERASVTNSGTCTVTDSSGGFTTTTSHPATGKCTLNFVSSPTAAYSATPTCIATVVTTGNGRIATIEAISSSSVTVRTTTDAGVDVDYDFGIICMGPR